MVDAQSPEGSTKHSPKESDDRLKLNEINHRWLNDLQLITSLLSLQAKRAKSNETREALQDASDRVSILARSRASLQNPYRQSLEQALRQVCEALQSQAGPRAIVISLETALQSDNLRHDKVTTIALIVNELATNAIKHAFKDGAEGRVKILVSQLDDAYLSVQVDDDGMPLPPAVIHKGFGTNLIQKLTASINGELITPNGSKCFELRVPLPQAS